MAVASAEHAAQPVTATHPIPFGADRKEGWPRHVAIITDGNGRWAERQGLPTLAGHEAGTDTVKATLRHAADFGVRELTVVLVLDRELVSFRAGGGRPDGAV